MQDLFRPTLCRLLIAIAVSCIGFWLPQEIPLEWYPLNNPGDDILYLKLKCTSNALGEVRISYATAGEFSPVNVIRWPIAPTKRSYTYVFPLRDAPITALQLESLSHGGVISFDLMRICNRGDREIHRFSAADFTADQQAAVIPGPDGSWSIVAKPEAQNPVIRIALPAPLIPRDANRRNFSRCLLSTGYLTLMLTVVLLAALFATYQAPRRVELFRRIGFVVILAFLFALVANRGLIRNSCRYATFGLADLPSPPSRSSSHPGWEGIHLAEPSRSA